jgi:CRISPR-associated protein Cst1
LVNTKTQYKLNSAYGNLFPVKRDDFPNNFWNLNFEPLLCPICAGLAYFHIDGFIKITNKKGVFINTPSFKLIWKLNQHLEKIHAKDAYKDIKTLFGVAFIDLVLDLNVKLGLWQKLSTEIIVFKGQNIDFYEIPPQILELLEDKRISSLLTSLNNLKILDLFLSGNFKLLEVLIYRLLRSAGSDKEDKLLKEFNLSYKPETVEIMSKLYALSVSKLKKTAEVEV